MLIRTRKNLSIALLILLLVSCQADTEQAAGIPEIPPKPVKILIAEIYAGEQGNNQADFIQLYNAGTEIGDLQGYSLWFQLKDGDEEVLVARWEEPALVPPLGFYALALEGQEFNVLPDLYFNQPLVPSRGGLSLRFGDEVIDQLSWGGGPTALAEGSPAPRMTPGAALLRRSTPEDGSIVDSDDNADDFELIGNPVLKNTGSPVNHSAADLLQLSIEIPPLVKPGDQFQIDYKISNDTGIDLQGLEFRLPIPETFSLEGGDIEPRLEGSQVVGTISSLENGAVLQGSIDLQAEYTFSDFSLHNGYLEAENWPLPSFAGPFYGKIGGGAIPIATARELIDKEVVVQGISTMYVGGFYAGSGAKFYLEDESGGIQVYVAGAGSSLVVPLGSTVQVRGIIQVYRDSIELVPVSQDQVEILESGGEESYQEPEQVPIEILNSQPEEYVGQLLSVEGRIGRLEEFSYSYEIDLFDPQGNLVSLYLDKETGITIEEIVPDETYRITGIFELYDGNWQLYPRLQSDLVRIFDPGLYVQAEPPTNVLPGDPFQVTFSITNHDSQPDQQVILWTAVDPQLEILEISEGGRFEGKNIVWEFAQLAGNSEIQPAFKARTVSDADYVSFEEYTVQSINYPEPMGGIPSYTFVGEGVPIWAIQGSGDRSPYVKAQLTTTGVVTGIFPELGGFWIQETQTDSDPTTSPGLFISTGPDLPEISRGDLVTVTGRVREYFQETELEVTSPAKIEIRGTESIPQPLILDPPFDNNASMVYFESLEGCLVSVPDTAVVVGPSTRYGEYAIVREETGVTRSWQDQQHGMLIHVDDGSSVTHESGDTLSHLLAVGDQVRDLVGPLAFTYGNYKIEPNAPYRVQTQPPTLKPLLPVSEGSFRIMTWNVENLFDFQVPHPSDPDLPTVSEYKRDIMKVALTIKAAGFPTVIGLQEVENIGVLEDITAEPTLADYDYQPFLIEGTDSRGIDVGYLVRGDRAEVLDVAQYPAPGNITSRPPLLVAVQPRGSQEVFYLLNNHFTSMSGGEEATEPRRNAQAAWNLEIARQLLAENPRANLVVMGDLNSYYDSPPLETLQAGGLTNLFGTLQPEERYTYIYEGNSQVLDHILVNQNLL
ncbi:MAG: endonuclease/exonuclease/phosphatase family protein, partial [Anaerolineales bacterium]